ncbi:MAG: hypothetical protein J0M11_03850 [Anaerolineae bacterium]|nr:hypothetical protein [Anaerolineae bacterium]
MTHDPEWKLLVHYWNRLSPLQRQLLISKARLYRLQQRVYYAILYSFIFVHFLVVPVPRRLQPKRIHWL